MTNTLRQLPITCSGHTRPVVHVGFSLINEFGYYLISASKDGKSQLMRGDTGDWLGTFDGHKGAVWAATLDKDALKAATGAADFSAKLWNCDTGAELHSFAHKHIVKSVDFNSEGTSLLTGSNEKLLRLFDLNNYDSEPVTLSGHTGNLKGALVLDENRIVSISDDKHLIIWDLRSSEKIIDKEFVSAPFDIELSRQNSRLTVSYGKHVVIYDCEKMDKLFEFSLPCSVYSASLHPTENVFVCGGEDFILYKCSTDNGDILEQYKGHFGPVHRIRYSPDGRLYASGSEDGTLRLWQNRVGDNYGLWKLENPLANGKTTTLDEVQGQTAVASA